jgi:Lar family restriction alleviation protein
MNELRECPFCGGSDLYFDDVGNYRWGAVHCGDCEMHGPLFRKSSGGEVVEGWEKTATTEWNRRASDTFTVTPAGRAALEGGE